MEEVAKDFEQHFKQRIQLLLRVPPISFIHHFGRFNDLEGYTNDSLEVEFLSDFSSESHFKIDIRPIKYGIPIREKCVKLIHLCRL